MKGELEPQLLEKVTNLLTEKIKEIEQQLPGATKVHVSVLAALNIAYDYFLLKEELEQTVNTLEARSHQWLAKLEAGFPGQSSTEV
ncbi:MAG: cell division protein ZapA [Deltaproteobacteria bacterium]|nr:cell division protein ZapA [Deltaproteobacteria bacterium]